MTTIQSRRYCEVTHILVELQNYLKLPRLEEHLGIICSKLKRNVASIYLMNPKVEINLAVIQCGVGTILKTSGFRSGIASAFSNIIGCQMSSIVPFNTSYKDISMTAFFSDVFSYTAQHQFIFLNDIFVDSKLFYNKINDFLDVTFGMRAIEPYCHYMYVIKIDFCVFKCIDLIEELENINESGFINQIQKCLNNLIKQMKHYDCKREVKFPSPPFKSSSTEEKIIDNFITKWFIYGVSSFVLKKRNTKLIKTCTTFNRHISKKEITFDSTNNQILRNVFRGIKYSNIDINSSFVKLCFKAFLKYSVVSMSYEMRESIDTCSLISLSFPKLVKKIYNTKFLPPFSILYSGPCIDDIPKVIATILNYSDNSLNNNKEISNIEGNFDLIANLVDKRNGLSNKALPAYKFCDRINNFIISERNPFLPKGSSPIMLIKDKLLNSTTTNEPLKLENVFTRMLNSSVEFNIENLRELKFSPNQTLWTVDKTFFNGIEVIGQLDKKYILCIGNTKVETEKHLIALDQHAIGERIQLETLLSNFSDPHYEENLKTHLLITDWLLIFLIKKDIQSILKYTDYFKKNGIQLTEISYGTIAVKSIPECLHWVASRKAKSIHHYYRILNDSVKNIFAEQVSNINESGTIRHIIPSVLYQQLCREACLQAVNFGKLLSLSDCQELMKNISSCSLPFMCAHGRPVVSFLGNIFTSTRNINSPTLQALKK